MGDQGGLWGMRGDYGGLGGIMGLYGVLWEQRKGGKEGRGLGPHYGGQDCGIMGD